MDQKGHHQKPEGRHKPQDQLPGTDQPMGALGYAVIGFAGLAVALLMGWYITQRLDVLASFGPQAYYVLLTLLGIAGRSLSLRGASLERQADRQLAGT